MNRRDVWAAVSDRLVPVATPPTVPWDRRAQAAEVLRTAFLRRDPAKVHARRIRRARRRAGAGAVLAGAFGVLAGTVGAERGLEVGEVAAGGGAAVAAAVALNATLRARELRRRPPPASLRTGLVAMLPPPRPPRDCPSRGPLDRLAERERALAGLLVHLGPAGDEPRAVATDAAARLRELGARVTAVDRARRGEPSLDAAVGELCGRLEAGVTAYGALVAAAADAVAAGARSDHVVALRLEEATDSLAGLASGLREVAN